MTPDLTALSHRPWPLPDLPWVMAQSWRELLFAHWRVDRKELARVVPKDLEVEEFDGSAWIGVVPFRIAHLHARGLPEIPGTNEFPELNVRTYVVKDGMSGVYFFSLDAANRLAVEAARVSFGLNYLAAEMRCELADGTVTYASRRTDDRSGDAAFAGRYRGFGETFHALPGTLEHFLAERYCLYSGPRLDRMWRADIHHPPWPLQRAEATIEVNTMTAPLGIPLEGPPHLLYSAGVDVAIWLPRAC